MMSLTKLASLLAELAENVSLLVVLALLVAHLVFRNFKASLPPLPPSLPRRPFIGNWHQMPQDHRWVTFRNWSINLGSPIIFLKIFQTPIIVLNDIKSITDLLDGRSSIYSDRPQPYFLCELVGQKLTVFTVSSEHPRLKQYRRMIHSGFDSRSIKSYSEIMEHYRDGLLKAVESNPKEFEKHVRRMAGGIILRTTYGWTVQESDDMFIKIFNEAAHVAQLATKPGAWLVDFFPILRFWPPWFLGGGFKRQARIFREKFTEFTERPFNWSKSQKNLDCFVNRLLEEKTTSDKEYENTVAYAAAGLYAGGVDTSVSALSYFLLLMVQYPEVQHRAQREIESVIGSARLPTLDDEDKLPYLSAVIKEVLRIRPPVPLGLPHKTLKEDVYCGYRVPVNSLVFANIWAALKDPSTYPNPEEFNPTRYLQDKGASSVQRDPRKLVFGFGRRRCPGEQIGLATLFLNAASLLAQYEIQPLKPEARMKLLEVGDTLTQPITRPEPFECRFIKRRNLDKDE